MMWRTFITSFLCLTLINTRTHWSEACPSFERGVEVAWIKASSTLHLQGKTYEPTATNVGPIYRRRTPREREIQRRIQKDYIQVDEGAELSEEISQNEEFARPTRQKENSFLLFLRKLGPQKKGRRRRRRRRINLHEPDPKPQKVFVRVHEPSETEPPADSADDDPPTSPPIVYAPPVPKEKYPVPGRRPGRRAPPKLSSSQETNSSTESDTYDYPSQRVYRTKRKRNRYHNNWDGDPVRKVHVYIRQGGPPSESANVSKGRFKSDDSDEDGVRQVHLMRDFHRPYKPKRRRSVAQNNKPSRPPLKNRRSSGPIPVVF